jgi:hypothetical protein
MVTRDEALKLGHQCIDWARTAKTDDERREFLKMAAALGTSRQ